MLELLIGLVVTFAVGYFIVKGYKPAGILLTAGILLLILTGILGHKVLPGQMESTGNLLTDAMEYVKYMLQNRGGGLGMQIMLLCGFASYMTHIGANNVVVKQFSKPLSFIKSPYILLVAAYLVACLMSLAVSSATGLGVLLMATLFPMMTAMGISRPAAVAVCASPAAIILSPTSGDVVIAAEKSGLPLHVFAVETVLPVSICAIIVMAAAAYFWNQYLDKKIIHQWRKWICRKWRLNHQPIMQSCHSYPSSVCLCSMVKRCLALRWISIPSLYCQFSLACWSTTSLNVSTVSKHWKILKPVTRHGGCL